MSDVWERRIRRAEDLQKHWPFAKATLRFFRAVTSFQMDLYRRAAGATSADAPLLDTAFLTSFLPPFLALVERVGPPDLSQQAQKLRDRTEADWERLLRAAWNRNGTGGDASVAFFPKAILQPFTLLKAERWRDEVGPVEEASTACPFCGRPPVVSTLREGGDDGIIRSLACSLCSTEWSYPRILCPSCREDRPERLPRYTAPEIPWMRVEGCEACHHYIKTVDLRRIGDAVPVVDEIGSTVLDVVARERNYTKLEVNIVGV